jgi:hypothetical protein
MKKTQLLSEVIFQLNKLKTCSDFVICRIFVIFDSLKSRKTRIFDKIVKYILFFALMK